MNDSHKKMYEIIKNALNRIKINGRNLDEVNDVDFILMSERFKDFSGVDILKKIENLFFEVYGLSYNEEYASSLPIVDGKVEIEPGTFFHVTPPSLSQIKNISMAGIVASEWFGIIESEREGLFCSFLNTVRSKEVNDEYDKALITKNECAYLGKWGECSLFFDPNNPLVQMLTRLDFFEYAHVKQTTPELLSQKYSKEEIEMLDFIYKFSCGKHFHDRKDKFLGRDLWVAIPGGIPSMLVAGVCVNMTNKKLKELQENISVISACFPNAVIFDENQNVLAYPKNYNSQKGK